MESVTFKLYHDAALRSARVKWLLHELVEDREVEYVDTYAGEQYSTRFLEINPNHAVPVLRVTLEDGSAMHMVESAAIIAFLADTFPARGLAPTAELSFARADYLQVLHFGEYRLTWCCGRFVFMNMFLPKSERDIRTVNRYKKKFTSEIEPQLRCRLDRTAFICGEKFSAADCVIGHCVLWARSYGLCAGETFDRYIGRLSERPALKSAFSDRHRFRPEVPRNSSVVAMFAG